MNGDRFQILLVEDNAADVRLMREAMGEARTPNDLQVAGDGELALAFLKGETPEAEHAAVDLVLLDLNLPRKSGLELLVEIRDDAELQLTPVIVLTTSTAEADVRNSYGQGANCFIVKPVDFEHFRVVVAAIDQFWLNVALLPGPGTDTQG